MLFLNNKVYCERTNKSCVSFLNYVLRLYFRLLLSCFCFIVIAVCYFFPSSALYFEIPFPLLLIVFLIIVIFLLPVLRLFLLPCLLLLFIPLVVFLNFIFLAFPFHTVLLLLFYSLFLLHNLPPSSHSFLSSPSFVYIPHYSI